MTQVSDPDADLITAVRGGDVTAYGTLYERHVRSAANLARQLSRSRIEADDLVSEAFARVLDTLRDGRGPDAAFRPYLLTALRHLAYDRTDAERRVRTAEDVTKAAPVESVSVPFTDTALAGLERSLAARAFARLPERWQMVLWHTEVEEESPADVAPLLGLTPNGVSALAYRAREGLKQAYLQVHLAETTEDGCRAATDLLGAWTRAGLSRRETTLVRAHLDECVRCSALAAELADVNSRLRTCVAPLVFGASAAGSASGGLAAKAVGAGVAGSGPAGLAVKVLVAVGSAVAVLAYAVWRIVKPFLLPAMAFLVAVAIALMVVMFQPDTTAPPVAPPTVTTTR
nr:sigma-70 region 2 domain protein [Kibdelosporangium sp. MJ126-NF4]CTQ94591.1 sigma-70 region 2 domain protein [Kibdelosporangium sp. MJ126-NF4]